MLKLKEKGVDGETKVCFIVQRTRGRGGTCKGFVLGKEEWGDLIWGSPMFPSQSNTVALGWPWRYTGGSAITSCKLNAGYVPDEVQERLSTRPRPKHTPTQCLQSNQQFCCLFSGVACPLASSHQVSLYFVISPTNLKLKCQISTLKLLWQAKMDLSDPWADVSSKDWRLRTGGSVPVWIQLTNIVNWFHSSKKHGIIFKLTLSSSTKPYLGKDAQEGHFSVLWESLYHNWKELRKPSYRRWCLNLVSPSKQGRRTQRTQGIAWRMAQRRGKSEHRQGTEAGQHD